MTDDNCEKDDDVPCLSAETFLALKEFYSEQDERDRRMAETSQAEVTEHANVKSMDAFVEDWQLSQFWYDEDTAAILARECLVNLPSGGRIACISCPSLFVALRREIEKEGYGDIKAKVEIKLFEYDKRFQVFGKDFIFYDYKSPLDIPRDLRESFDMVFADPPFLSEECLTKTAVTIKFLAKDKIVLCTGKVMGELAERLLSLKLCKFLPKHKNNLANEFRCFANYNALFGES